MSIDVAISTVLNVLEDAAPNLDRHRAASALRSLVTAVLAEATRNAGALVDDASVHTHPHHDDY
jgi:hypothetical protein